MSRPAGSGVSGEPYTRAQRLLNLTMALRESSIGLDRVTIRSQVRGYEPGGEVAAFERMFERDKDDLRALGMPLETLTDPHGNVTGYRITGDWTLPAIELTPADLALLSIAARAWRSTDLGPAAVNALRKVETRLVSLHGDRRQLPPGREGLDPGQTLPQGGGAEGGERLPGAVPGLTVDAANLDQLRSAVRDGSRITFGYHRSGTDQPSRRRVSAWGLVWWRGHWYLVGHDADRAEARVFRASRIVGGIRVDPQASAVPRPAGFDPRAAVGQFADRGVTVDVALAPGRGAALRRVGTPIAGARDDEASSAGAEDRFVIRGSDLPGAVASVLSHGGAARVVGPPPAVEEARRQLLAIIESAGIPAAAVGRARLMRLPGSPGLTQFSRLLALIPWLARNSGVSIREAAAHFGISERQLLQDLGAVITSGPDDWTLFDLQYWDNDGRISMIDPLALGSALSLTPEEGFALVIALDALAQVATAPVAADQRDHVEELTRKLRSCLGPLAPQPGEVGVRVDLPDQVVDVIGRARAAGVTVELTYLVEARDEVTRRTVDPIDLVVVDGRGYVRGHCRQVGAVRSFRVDRILEIGMGTDTARSDLDAPEPGSMAASLSRSGRRVVLDASPSGQHIVDRLPVQRAWDLPDGWIRVEVPVGDYEWARRLVLASAGNVVVREPATLADEVAREAAGALEALERSLGAEAGLHTKS